MTKAELKNHPHRRFNPLTREWVLVSPHRTQRPWQGKVEEPPHEEQRPYDPDCYLCPGNARAGAARNPDYSTTFVFDNDYAALRSDTPKFAVDDTGLIVSQTERGICQVICFSPRHDLTVSRMSSAELRQIVDVWIEQYRSLMAIPWVRYVQIFENRGAAMGASNPHPHCQVWASADVPNEPAKEQAALHEYRQNHNSCLLCDYVKLERARGERIVVENGAFTVLVPYWAVWPFETLLLSERHVGSIDELADKERDSLAGVLRQLTIRYDNLFETPFPYSMGFHQQSGAESHFHAHYYPPLLRSATVQKFMVGYEMLATPQRDTTPESAAARLCEVSDTHYLERQSAK